MGRGARQWGSTSCHHSTTVVVCNVFKCYCKLDYHSNTCYWHISAFFFLPIPPGVCLHAFFHPARPTLFFSRLLTAFAFFKQCLLKHAELVPQLATIVREDARPVVFEERIVFKPDTRQERQYDGGRVGSAWTPYSLNYIFAEACFATTTPRANMSL